MQKLKTIVTDLVLLIITLGGTFKSLRIQSPSWENPFKPESDDSAEEREAPPWWKRLWDWLPSQRREKQKVNGSTASKKQVG